MRPLGFCVAILGALAALHPAVGRAQNPFCTPPPQFESVEVSGERKITFRVHAPKAEAVRLSTFDIPGVNFGADMKKGDKDIWEVTVGPVPAGAYRYQFNVDGLTVADPRNTVTSESNLSVSSLVYVPGSEVFDAKDVPHGAVAEVNYNSQSLKHSRRMHIYTPPGYEKSQEAYPVLYLLHGAFDCDDSWSTVGRAGYILDNLIASKKAKPMVVVMPAGHTSRFRFGGAGGNSLEKQIAEFIEDFNKDLRPYVEKNYRLVDDRDHRAIAGLSMGGAQTLDIAFGNLQDYGYVGVYSSGIFGIAGGFGGAPPSTDWEDRHKATLDNAEVRKGLKLVWFGVGKEDFLLKTSQGTTAMLKTHGFQVVENETDGGHTWINWRNYLSDFAPLLFVEK